MIFRLKSIKKDSKLAGLFNSYQSKLHTLVCCSCPAYYSMKVVNQQTLYRFKDTVENYFQLNVLSNSLHSLHYNIEKAIEVLNEYLTEYNGDWKDYAISKRVACISDYGGNDSDYDEHGNVIPLSDNESIRSYTVFHDLCNHIGGNYAEEFEKGSPFFEIRGEGIGSSSANDFEKFSLVVENETDFSIVKFLREQGTSITLFKTEIDENEEEVQVPMSLAEEIENEMNTDIKNREVAILFRAVITAGTYIREEFEKLTPFDNHTETYKWMLEALRALLNLDVRPFQEIAHRKIKGQD